MTGLGRITSSLLFAVAIAVPAEAGIAYRFEQTSDDPATPGRSGRVELADRSYRVEFDADPENEHPYDLLLSKDDGQHVTAIHRADKTYFALDEMPPMEPGRQDLRLPGARKASLHGLKVSIDPPAAGPAVFGHATSLNVLHASYSVESNFGSEIVRQLVNVEARLWTAADLPRRRLPIDPGKVETGTADLDAAIAKTLAPLAGQVLRQELVIARRYEGGQPFSSKSGISIQSWDESAAAAARFEMPPGLRHQVPEFSTPTKIH